MGRSRALEAAVEAPFLWETLRKLEQTELHKAIRASDVSAAVAACHAVISASIALRRPFGSHGALQWLANEATDGSFRHVAGGYVWLSAFSAAALLHDDVAIARLGTHAVEVVARDDVSAFDAAAILAMRKYAESDADFETLGDAVTRVYEEADAFEQRRWRLKCLIWALIAAPTNHWETMVIRALDSYDATIEAFGRTEWRWPVVYAGVIELGCTRHGRSRVEHPYLAMYAR